MLKIDNKPMNAVFIKRHSKHNGNNKPNGINKIVFNITPLMAPSY